MLNGKRRKEVFSLRHEIGKCPNIEVEIDVMEQIPIFHGQYHVREEDKALIDRDEPVVLFRHIKRDICSLFQSSNVD